MKKSTTVERNTFHLVLVRPTHAGSPMSRSSRSSICDLDGGGEAVEDSLWRKVDASQGTVGSKKSWRLSRDFSSCLLRLRTERPTSSTSSSSGPGGRKEERARAWLCRGRALRAITSSAWYRGRGKEENTHWCSEETREEQGMEKKRLVGPQKLVRVKD